MKKSVFISLVLAFYSIHLQASHINGVEISYNQKSEDSIEVFCTIIRDCAGTTFNQSSIVAQINGCGFRDFIKLDLDPLGFPNFQTGNTTRFSSQVCKNTASTSTCHGGSINGIQIFRFKGVYVIPTNITCSDWLLSYTPPCCINNNNLVNPPNAGLQARATLKFDSTDFNSSNYSTDMNYIEACVNSTHKFSLSSINPDNDSLVYQIDTASYISGHHQTLPPQAFTIHPTLGTITLQSQVAGSYFIAVKINEYNSTTKRLKGSSNKVFFVTSQNCNNAAPSHQMFITSAGDGAKVIDSTNVNVCLGSPFWMKTFLVASDTADSVYAYTNLKEVFPTATLQKTYKVGLYDTLFLTIRDTVGISSPGHFQFFIRAFDNHCPILGVNDFDIGVHALHNVYAGADQTICKGTEWISLQAIGGNSFKWSVVSGAAFDTVATSPSYNANRTTHTAYSNIRVSPAIRTVYSVSSNTNTRCLNSDTLVVDVAHTFSLSSQYKHTICYGEKVHLTTTPSSGQLQDYTYRWHPESLIDSTNLNQSYTSAIREDRDLIVTAISDSGCARSDTLSIAVGSLPFFENISLTSPSHQICLGDTTNISALYGSLNVRPCEIGNTPCQGTKRTVSSSQTGTNNSSSKTNYSLPTLLTSGSYGNRTQYLYSRNLLLSMGLTEGYISSLGFLVTLTGGVSPRINNLTVKMGCTTEDNLDSATYFLNNTKVVRQQRNEIISGNGWWDLSFDDAYYWDGSSNLVVDICWSQSSVSNANHAMTYLSTSYNSAIQTLSNSASMPISCFGSNPINTLLNPYRYVPIIRFDLCQGTNLAGFTHQWQVNSPNTALTGQQPSRVNFSSSQPGLQNIHLIVNDTSGLCTDTASINIEVVTKFKTRPLIDMDSLFCTTEGVVHLNAPKLPYHPMIQTNWSGPGITHPSGVFAPSVAGKGQHNVVYEISGTSCASKDTFSFLVSEPFDAAFSLNKICAADSIVDLQPIHRNGVWIGEGILDSLQPYFHPSQLFRTPVSGATDTVFVYHELDSLGCKSRDTGSVVVFGEYIPELLSEHSFHERYFCLNEPPRTLLTTKGNMQWSGTGISSNGEFNPTAAGYGTHIVRADSIGFCGGSDTFALYVPQVKIPKIHPVGPYCDPQSQSIVVVPSNHTGTWSAPLPAGQGSWMNFSSEAKFRPSIVVQSHGYGQYPLFLTVSDTIYSKHNRQNVCQLTDSVEVSFIDSLDISLGEDIYTCGQLIDTVLSINSTGSILWSTGDTTPSIRVISSGSYWVQVSSGNGTCQSADTIKISDNCMDIVEPQLVSKINVYPNPANSVFTIENLSIETQFVTILNPTGAKVWSGAVRMNEKSEIRVSHWASGVYWVQISGDSTREVRRLVVTRR